MTSADVDKDPQLNALLWDDVVAALEADALKYEQVFEDAAKKTVESLKNVFTVFFARHPEVEALAFSLTTAEYDDEGYGGYNFIEMRPRFFDDALKTKEAKEYVAMHEAYDAGFVATHFSGYGRVTACPSEMTAAINEVTELDRLLNKVRAFAERAWGECGILVTREKISKFHDGYELRRD